MKNEWDSRARPKSSALRTPRGLLMRELLRLGARGAHHREHALRLGIDHLPHVRRRAADHLVAEVRHPPDEVRLPDGFLAFGVELLDDGPRRALGREQADPDAGLVAR